MKLFNSSIKLSFLILVLLVSLDLYADSSSNGSCATADTILSGTRMSGTVQNSSADREDWYVYTAPADGFVSFVYQSQRDTHLYVRKNGCPSSNTYRVLRDGQSYNNTSSPIAVQQNDTVYIRIRENFGGNSSRTSWYNIDLTFTASSGGGGGGYDFTSSNFRPYVKININGEDNTNINGDMTIIGNSQLECDQYYSSGWRECNGAAPAGIPNNNIRTQHSNHDGDSSTFNSTAADVLTTGAAPVPADATVVWAGLYWQGRMRQSFSDSVKTSGDTVKLKIPGGTYVSVTADTYNWINTSSSRFDFQGFTDITNIVNSDPHGRYWVADIQADDGTDDIRNRYGAWSIVIVYASNTKPLKNISIYDGYKSLYNSVDPSNGVFASIDVTLSGFLTPTSGDIDSTFFVFAGEGDQAYNDGIWMDDVNSNRQPVTSTNNNDGNQINSTETNYGTNVTSRFPSYVNTIGIDIDAFNVGTVGTGHLDIIGHSQTSTNFRMESHGDRYFPAVFAFSTELYQPNLCYFEEVFDKYGNSLQDGAEVTYGDDVNVKVYFLNEDNEIAQQVHIWRTFETALPYHQQTTFVDNLFDSNVNPTPSFVSVTDDNDSDIFFFDIVGISDTELTGQFLINLGTDANSTHGGDFDPGQESMLEYNATVNTDQNYTINYNIAYLNPITGDLYNGQLTNKCQDFNNTFWGRRPTGEVLNSVDVMDTYSGSGASYDSTIYTKVSGKTTTARAVYLGDDSANPVPQNYSGAIPMQVILKLADMSGGATCASATEVPLSSYQVIRITNGNAVASSGSFAMAYAPSGVKLAKRDVRYKYKVIDLQGLVDLKGLNCSASNLDSNLKGIPQCLNAENKYVFVFGQDTWDNCGADTVGNATGGPCTSSNNGVGNAPYDHEYGCLECSTEDFETTCSRDNFAIRPEVFTISTTETAFPDLLRAGQNYGFTINAVDYGTNVNSMDYNQTSANLSTDNTVKYYATGTVETNSTNLPGVATLGDFNMTNGVSMIAGAISPALFQYSEVGDITIHIEDQEFASVDAGEGTDNCDANGSYVCGNQNATFIPDHFLVNATLRDNAGGNTFTYLSSDLNMSARYNVTITAQNALNATTQNFRMGGDYYENPVALTATVPNNTTLGAAVVDNISAAMLGFTLGQKNIIWNDSNTSLILSFNYPRTSNNPVNPFLLDGSLTSVDANSTYIATAGTAEVNGTDVADSNVTFVYGRAHMARTRAMCNGSPCTGNVTFFYEFYGKKSDADYNQTLITNLLGSRPKRSIDSVNWFQNTAHITTNGDGNVTSSINTIPYGGGNPPLYTQFTTNTSGAFEYDGTQGYPYKATIELDSTAGNTQSWLIYDKYNTSTPRVSGQLEYYGRGNWTSSGPDSLDTKSTNNTNANKNTNRRIRW